MTEEKELQIGEAMEPCTGLNGYYAPSDIAPIIKGVLGVTITPKEGQVILDCLKWAITEKGWQHSQAWRMHCAEKASGETEEKVIAE